MARLKDMTVSIEVKNLDDLKELLQKATDQMEQLEITLEEISSYELDVSAKIINQVKSELDDYFNSLLEA